MLRCEKRRSPSLACADALAEAIGRTKPLRLPPASVAKLGGAKTALLARSERVRNTRFRETAGWAPQSPTAREAWKKIVAEVQHSSADELR